MRNNTLAVIDLLLIRKTIALAALLLLSCAPAYAENTALNWHVKQKHQVMGNVELYLKRDEVMIHFLDSRTKILANSRTQKLFYFNPGTKQLFCSNVKSFTLPVSRLYLMTAPDLQFDPNKWRQVAKTIVPNVGQADVYKCSFQYKAGAADSNKGFIVGTGRILTDETRLVLYPKIVSDPSLIQLICRIYSLPWLGKFPISAKINSDSVERLHTITITEEPVKATNFELPKGLTSCKTPEGVAASHSQSDFENMIGPNSELDSTQRHHGR
jgi:hypothetical protein